MMPTSNHALCALGAHTRNDVVPSSCSVKPIRCSVYHKADAHGKSACAEVFRTESIGRASGNRGNISWFRHGSAQSGDTSARFGLSALHLSACSPLARFREHARTVMAGPAHTHITSDRTSSLLADSAVGRARSDDAEGLS